MVAGPRPGGVRPAPLSANPAPAGTRGPRGRDVLLALLRDDGPPRPAPRHRRGPRRHHAGARLAWPHRADLCQSRHGHRALLAPDRRHMALPVSALLPGVLTRGGSLIP